MPKGKLIQITVLFPANIIGKKTPRFFLILRDSHCSRNSIQNCSNIYCRMKNCLCICRWDVATDKYLLYFIATSNHRCLGLLKNIEKTRSLSQIVYSPKISRKQREIIIHYIEKWTKMFLTGAE